MKIPSMRPKQLSVAFSVAATLVFIGGGNPAFAGDPFRTQNPRDISDATEAAIEAIFVEGDYPKAQEYLTQALADDADEPLVYAIQGGLAYSDRDWSAIAPAASKTLETARQLMTEDPLRGNLYLAIGHFIEGAYLIKTEGPLAAVPKLKQVLEALEKAEKIDASDPELNLFKGYMQLMLAVNVPFSSPEQAIADFQNNAAPAYIVNRGIAVAYRDLKQYDKAMEFAQKALAIAPNNPELLYLKAQLLYHQGKQKNNPALVRESVTLFDTAIAKQDQLPQYIQYPLEHERRVAQTWLSENQ